MTALVQTLCDDLAPSALAEGVELALEAAPGLALKAQPDLLRAALRNLIENAVRHSPTERQWKSLQVRLPGASNSVSAMPERESRGPCASVSENAFAGP